MRHPWYALRVCQGRCIGSFWCRVHEEATNACKFFGCESEIRVFCEDNSSSAASRLLQCLSDSRPMSIVR